MRNFSLSHLDNRALKSSAICNLSSGDANEAYTLAHVAEMDVRKMFLPEAYSSMKAYCVQELRMSDDVASKRIHAARTARQFPVLFEAVADGRLHLSAVETIASRLSEDNVDALVAAATHKTRAEIRAYLAQRFPRPDVPTQVQPITPASPPAPLFEQHAPAHVGTLEHAPAHVETPSPRPKVTPLAPQRFALQLTMSQEMYDKLGYAQCLLSHQIPSGDIVQVLDRALDELILKLERSKYAATTKPRSPRQRSSADPRDIPADVKRAVLARDAGRCTFESESGRRCEERRFLEFDHTLEVARGGEATVENLRLRCRPHNQYTAECTFGAGFMEEKREQARREVGSRAAAKQRAMENGRAMDAAPRAEEAHVVPVRGETRVAEEARADEEAPAAEVAQAQATEAEIAPGQAAAEQAAVEQAAETAAAEQAIEQDLASVLRSMRYSADEVRRGIAICRSMPGASLDERIRAAFTHLCRVPIKRRPAEPAVPESLAHAAANG